MARNSALGALEAGPRAGGCPACAATPRRRPPSTPPRCACSRSTSSARRRPPTGTSGGRSGASSSRGRPCRPSAAPRCVDAPGLEAMCRAYEEAIARAGGLDLVMLGLGPNGHIASNEPGSAFDSPTRPVRLLPETARYILTDEVSQGAVSDRAVTLGIGTILRAREVVVLVSGAAKRGPLERLLDGPVTPEVPASALRLHPRCTVLADRDARP